MENNHAFERKTTEKIKKEVSEKLAEEKIEFEIDGRVKSVYSLHKNKGVWGSLGVNKAVVDELKKQGLYPMRGPWDSWKKSMIVTFFLNVERVIR